MILGIGTDIIETARFADITEKTHFLERIFTEDERARILASGAMAPQRAAGIFTAKEAAAKALGTGFADGVRPCEIETVKNAGGSVSLCFHGQAQERFLAIGGRKAFLSISHIEGTACAFAVLEGETPRASDEKG